MACFSILCCLIIITACGPGTAVTHTVTFDANGGGWDTGDSVTAEVPDGTPIWDCRPSVPVRSGYNFRGWFSDRNATEPYDPNSLVTEDAVLYAGWTAHIVYRVTFDTEGGTSVAPELVEDGETAHEPPVPERSGYSFIGWSLDGTESQLYDFSAPVGSSMTLHAVWKKERTVTFLYDLPSSIGSEAELTPLPEKMTVPDGETVQAVTPVLSYNGTEFRFLGWFEADSQSSFDFTEAIGRDIELHGRWEEHAVSAAGEYVAYSEAGLGEWAVKAPQASCAIIADISLSDAWEPVGTESSPYDAAFSGNGHTVSGLKIDGDHAHSGFFGYIGSQGRVSGLRIAGAGISAEGSAGGIAGENLGTIENCMVSGAIEGAGIAEGGIAGRNRGKISGCSSDVSIKGYGDVGGIAGVNFGTIERCSGAASVTGEYATGGIAGLNTDGGTIASSVFSGQINDGYYAGGIAGCNDNESLISGCSFTGTINDLDWYIGGIAGLNSNESVIKECSSSGNITGTDEAGGIVGYSFAAYVYACSFSGSVRSETICGGIAGISMGELEACYSSGTVSAGSTAGGVAGINRFHEMTACYSTGDVSGGDTIGSITGLNEKADIFACFWEDGSNLPGIGRSISPGTEDLREIGDGYTWDDAAAEMNSSLGSGYIFVANKGADADGFPLIAERI